MVASVKWARPHPSRGEYDTQLTAFHYSGQKTFYCQDKWPTLTALRKDGRKLELEHTMNNLNQRQGRNFQRECEW